MAPAGAADMTASRTVDRTLLCKPTGTGYPDPVRVVDVAVSPRLGSSSPSGSFYSPPNGPNVQFETGPRFGRGAGSVWFANCTTSRARIGLSAKGLRGGRTRLGDRHKCDVPARLLVRIRAVFRTPVTLRRERDGLIARGRIVSAELQVVAERGRTPIAYLTAADGSGRAQLFTNRTLCYPA